MKRIVVYNSSTGFTKQYAEWIAKELGCEAVELKKTSVHKLNDQDMVIFGGWIMGNMIMGLDKIRKNYNGNLVVFATGSSDDSETVRNAIVETSKLGATPFFYFVGGFKWEKLGFFKKMMLNVIKKSIAKKEVKSEQDIVMEKTLGTTFDHSNRESIKPLIQFVQQ